MHWLIAGIAIGAGFCFFAQGAAAGRFKIRWYQWLFAIGAVALYLLTLQNYMGFQSELEPGTANLMLVLMGVPAVILTALIWIVPMFTRGTGKGKSSTPTAKMS